MKKCDFLIIAVCIIFAAMWIFSLKEGSTAAIYVNGELYEKLPLSKDARLTVKSEFGENTVVISDGEVFVINSDCENKDCQREKISAASRSLVCLPNRLSVIVEAEKEGKKAHVII